MTGPGPFPCSTPTTPVFAIPVVTFRPSARSSFATSSAVRVSRFDNSGFW